eukprot:4409353-Alexandrium_andersonii.AAC.1
MASGSERALRIGNVVNAVGIATSISASPSPPADAELAGRPFERSNVGHVRKDISVTSKRHLICVLNEPELAILARVNALDFFSHQIMG